MPQFKIRRIFKGILPNFLGRFFAKLKNILINCIATSIETLCLKDWMYSSFILTFLNFCYNNFSIGFNVRVVSRMCFRLECFYFTIKQHILMLNNCCLLYTSDAADEEDSVDLGGRRIIKK